MRSIRPALKSTRFIRQRCTPLRTPIPRTSIISPKSLSRRFYSEQRENPKAEETGEKQEKEDPKKHYKEDTSPPPDPNKSPFQVFVDTFRSELSKSRELQETVKALQDESGKIGDSEALRRAKEAYAKAREQSDRASSATGKVLKKAANTVGHAASVTWESPVVKSSRKVVSSTASTVAKGVSTATEPIRQNEIYKSVSASVGEAIDDGSSSRYGGYRDRAERRRLREAWEKKNKNRRVEENPEAGSNVVLHKDSAWKEQWNQFKEENSVLQNLIGFKRTHYDESENPLVSGVRSATDWLSDTWSGMFAETEVAGVVRRFKEMDPSFNMEFFNTELREWIIPEIVDAYVKGDVETLSQWLSEAPLSVWQAGLKPSQEMGLRPDGQVLDIRGVDIMTAKLLPQLEIPVFVISFRTQEIHVYRDIKTGEVKAGVEDRIQQVTYAMVMTRIPEDIFHPETNGWKVVDFARQTARDYM